MEPSSPFLKIFPYEVARGWVEGVNGHKVSVEGTANIKLPDSRRAHHVSDYLLAGIEGCGYKDQACFFVAYHDDSGWSGCSCNHGVYCGYYGEYGDCLSHTVGMLWGDWNVCTFKSLRLPLAKGSSTFSPSPSSSGSGDVTALRCSEPLRSKVGGPKRSSPYYAGWDRQSGRSL